MRISTVDLRLLGCAFAALFKVGYAGAVRRSWSAPVIYPVRNVEDDSGF